jgi:lipid-A-disaccharide synthase-like uncharacterized protein
MFDWFTWEHAWILIGFGGQAVFTSRMLVQWWASEQVGRSVVPIAFWWLSVIGGTILLLYAIYRRDPVIISGQALGLIVYVRNLYLIFAERSRSGDGDPPATK